MSIEDLKWSAQTGVFLTCICRIKVEICQKYCFPAMLHNSFRHVEGELGDDLLLGSLFRLGSGRGLGIHLLGMRWGGLGGRLGLG